LEVTTLIVSEKKHRWLPMSVFEKLEHLILWGFFSVKKGNKQKKGTIT
jgi:hypothetical protein